MYRNSIKYENPPAFHARIHPWNTGEAQPRRAASPPFPRRGPIAAAVFAILLGAGYAKGADTEAWIREYERFAAPAAPDPAEWPASPAGILPSAIRDSLQAALRGNIEMAVKAENSAIRIQAHKQDLNVSEGPDELEITVYDAFGEEIADARIGDDGNTGNRFSLGPVQQGSFIVNLPSPGLYTIRTQASRDCYYDISTDAAGSALVSTLEFLDGSRSIDLFFQAPPGRLEINLSTIHTNGLNQTIELFDSRGGTVDSVFMDQLSTSYVLTADVPPEEQSTLWRIHIPKQDLVIRSQQARYWFRSPDERFDVESAVNLLKPRVLRMNAAPGMTVPLRFEIRNGGAGPVEVTPTLAPAGGPTIETGAMPAAVRVEGGTRTVLYLTATVPADYPAPATTTLLVSLEDGNGGVLIQSKARVAVRNETPGEIGVDYAFRPPAEIEALRERIANGSDTERAIRESVLRTADRFAAESLQVPEEEAQWTGWYVCDGIGDGNEDPNDGDNAPLIFDPLRPGVFICSTDGRRYRGGRYHRGWLGHYYFELCSRIRTLGYAYTLDPNPAYAQYARQVLLDLADRYNSWPLDDYLENPSPRGARMMTETLGEAMCLSWLMTGYDALRLDPSFGPEDRLHIETNLARPASGIIASNPMGVTNWQSWHNTAIGLSGYIMGDAELIETAIHGGNGFTFVRDVAIRDDGLWQEGSIGYHFFGMSAMNVLLEALNFHGEPVYDGKIERAYSSILDVMAPDGSFEPLNDTGRDFIWNRREHYEHANAHYGNPVFDEILTFVYERLGYPRNRVETVIFGRGYESRPFSSGSALKREMGIAVARSGNRLDDQYALMDYGPQGMFHGHFDKLHLSLFGQGEAWLPDLGTRSTNTPEFTAFFRNTIGHNTVVLGERPQGAGSEEPREIGTFQTALPNFQAMQSSFSAPVYPEGSEVVRTVVLARNDYTAVIDEISGAPSPIDVMFHSAGDWFGGDDFLPLGGAPGWSGNAAGGYAFLQPPRLFNGTPAEAILRRETEGWVQARSAKDFGFSDRCENVDDWSGNIGLSDDATEGQRSISWVIVPRSFQSIRKTFHLLGENETPDRMTFDYKIGGATFGQLEVRLTGPPAFLNDRWIVEQSENAQPGVWRTADLDLTSPDTRFGTGLQFNQLEFALTGAENLDGSFLALIDNIRVYKDGTELTPERRGLQLAFPGGEPTQYFLAHAPSIDPPRRHPVLVARRAGVSGTRHVSILEPYLESPRILRAFVSENGVTVTGENFEDTLEIGAEGNRFSLIREDSSGKAVFLAALNRERAAGAGLAYEAAEPAAFSIELTEQTPGRAVYEYRKPAGVADALRIESPSEPLAVSINGMEAGFEPGDGAVTLENLPPGEQKLILWFEPPATAVPDWPLLDGNQPPIPLSNQR